MTANEQTRAHLDTLRKAQRALRGDCGVTLLGMVGYFAHGEQISASDVDVVYRHTEGRVVTLIHEYISISAHTLHDTVTHTLPGFADRIEERLAP